MSTDRTILEAQLAQAEEALNNLLTGQTVTKSEYEGHSVEFAKPSETGLRRRINELKRKLGLSVAGSRRARM